MILDIDIDIQIIYIYSFVDYIFLVLFKIWIYIYIYIFIDIFASNGKFRLYLLLPAQTRSEDMFAILFRCVVLLFCASMSVYVAHMQMYQYQCIPIHHGSRVPLHMLDMTNTQIWVDRSWYHDFVQWNKPIQEYRFE